MPVQPKRLRFVRFPIGEECSAASSGTIVGVEIEFPRRS
jgi:hypothetical protein